MLIASEISKSNKNKALLYSGRILDSQSKVLHSNLILFLLADNLCQVLLCVLLNKEWTRSFLKMFNSNILWFYEPLQIESMYKKMSQTKESRKVLRKME